MRRAFTLIEMTVAVALLVVVMAMSGVIFRVGIESHRLALANAEIMRKFRTITDQLDADLKGLCKDGEIFIVWDADDQGRSTGLDRIMFFSKGDFYAFGTTGLRGNLARISYALTVPEDLPMSADPNNPAQRILTRIQHILTADDSESLREYVSLADANTTDVPDVNWLNWNNQQEHARNTLKEWLERSPQAVVNTLSVVMDTEINVEQSDGTVVTPTVNKEYWDVHISRNDPNTFQNILCESVGTFRIQGWYDPCQTWVPDDDPDNDPDTQDTDYVIDRPNDEQKDVSGVMLSPFLRILELNSDGRFSDFNLNEIKADTPEELFSVFPGLGRALKFTFTLYDRRGLIPGGRTFTHIVYLDR